MKYVGDRSHIGNKSETAQAAAKILPLSRPVLITHKTLRKLNFKQMIYRLHDAYRDFLPSF